MGQGASAASFGLELRIKTGRAIAVALRGPPGAPEVATRREFVEKTALAEAAPELGLDETALRRALGDMGRAIGPPWRSDEKMAALGGWLALLR